MPQPVPAINATAGTAMRGGQPPARLARPAATPAANGRNHQPRAAPHQITRVPASSVTSQADTGPRRWLRANDGLNGGGGPTDRTPWARSLPSRYEPRLPSRLNSVVMAAAPS